MAIFNNSIIPAAAAAADDVVTKSCRFNSDGYLTRTFSASTSDQKKRTISFWVKRSELDDNGHQPIISYNASNAGGTWAFSGSGAGGSAVNDDFVMNDRNDTSGDADYLIRTTGLFRDVAAFYHFCIKYDTTNVTPADRIQIWVNGKRVTALNMGDTGYPALNYTTTRLFTASTGSQYVGGNGHASTHLDGYLSDFYFIDGTALDATSFAEEDATTGQWKPKAYSGTYGDNGFHLEMKETGTGTASSTTIGADTSGEDNHFSTTGLVPADVVEDTPTNSYATLNALDRDTAHSTMAEGNLYWATSSYSDYAAATSATIQLPSSGKWYFEYRISSVGTGHRGGISITDDQTSCQSAFGISSGWNTGGSPSNQVVVFVDAYSGGGVTVGSTTPESLGTGDYIMSVAIDSGAKKLWARRDGGSWYDSGDPANGTDPNATWTLDYSRILIEACNNTAFTGSSIVRMNFGADPTFQGTYSTTPATSEFAFSPPTAFKALSTGNLPTPTIAKPSEHFDTDLWTGDSSTTRDIATPFDPAFVWIKCRSNSGNGADHTLWDSLRGVSSSVNTGLSSSHPEPEGFQNDITTPMQYGGVSVLGTELYTLKEGAANARYVNETGRTYVGWSWKAGSTATNEVYNADSGFSIVKWTGDDNSMSGDAQRVSHSLGVAPELILAKNRWNTGAPDNFNWQVYHKDVGASKYLILNNSNAEASYETNNSIVPYSTTDVDFRDDMGTSDTIYMNQGDSMYNDPPTPETYAAYFFASKAGYSKVGSYLGNASADGTFVALDFAPIWIMVKSLGSASWYIHDTARSPYNYSDLELQADSSGAEYSVSGETAGERVDLLSNGFKHRTTNDAMNGIGSGSGQKYIFYAVGQSSKYASAR